MTGTKNEVTQQTTMGKVDIHVHTHIYIYIIYNLQEILHIYTVYVICFIYITSKHTCIYIYIYISLSLSVIYIYIEYWIHRLLITYYTSINGFYAEMAVGG